MEIVSNRVYCGRRAACVQTHTFSKLDAEEGTHHGTDAIHNKISLADVEKRLARDFARATVVAENLHHAHASINVNFAAAWALFFGLVHFRADGSLFNFPVHRAGIADIDRAGRRKRAFLGIPCDCPVAREGSARGVCHYGHHKVGHDNAAGAVLLAAYFGVLFLLADPTHSRGPADLDEPRPSIADRQLVALLLEIRRASVALWVFAFLPPNTHLVCSPAGVLVLLHFTVLVVAVQSLLQDMYVDNFGTGHNAQGL